MFASQYYPNPTGDGLQNNYLNSSTSQSHGNQGDIKGDWIPSEKDHFLARYSQSAQAAPSSNTFPLFFGSFNDYVTQGGVVDWTHTFGPSLVNEFRSGINYVKVNTGNTDNGLGNINEAIGIAGANSPGLIALNFSSAVASNIGTSNVTQLFANTTFQVGDTLIWTHGKHVVHTGFQFMRHYVNTYYSGNNGRDGLMDYYRQIHGRADALAVAGGWCRCGRGGLLPRSPGSARQGCQHRNLGPAQQHLVRLRPG